MALYHSAKGPVDYTVVGSPTIVDGVVSGITNNQNYIETASALPSVINSFEMVVRFKNYNYYRAGVCYSYKSGYYTYGGFFINYVDPAVTVQKTMWRYKPQSTSSEDTNPLILPDGSSHYSPNNWVYLKCTMTPAEGGKFLYAMYDSADGVTWQLMGSQEDTYQMTGDTQTTLKFQANPNQDIGNVSYTISDLDLNQTYIKVNGQPWFGVCPVEVKKHQLMGPVDYTVVGSPTIENGIISNATSSNYVNTVTSLDGNSDYELQYKFIFNESFTSSRCLQLTNSYYMGWDIAMASIRYHAGKNSNNSWCKVSGSYSLSLNTWYWLKLIKTGDNFKMYISTDGISFEEIRDITFSDISYQTQTIGIARQESGRTFPGSIDLNETYIKVNGKLWFYQPAPTKYIQKDDKLVWADPRIALSGPVNYTVVGSPTIVDGIASGFSSSNYLQTNQSVDIQNMEELVIKMKIDDSISYTSGNRTIIDSRPQKIKLVIYKTGTQIFANVWTEGGISTYLTEINTTDWFWLKVVITGGSLSLWYSNDGNSFSQLGASIIPQYSGNTSFLFGVDRFNQSQFFPGAIDLNETYIKVNDQLWFYGKNYATQNIVPVPAGYTYGTTTTPSIGYVDMRTQQFTAAPQGATIGRDE